MIAVLLLLATPAAAADDSGEVTDTGLTVTHGWLLYVGIPVALFAVIALLAALPRLIHRPRYRPGRPWPHDPLWFAGPEEPDAALAGARPLPGTGGASGDW